MSAVKKVDHPRLYPGRTVWGSTSGPVVYCGAVLPDTEKVTGVHVFHDERESREIVVAWGWPLPEKHAEVVAERDELLERVSVLEAQLAERGDIDEALERVAALASANRGGESSEPWYMTSKQEVS